MAEPSFVRRASNRPAIGRRAVAAGAGLLAMLVVATGCGAATGSGGASGGTQQVTDATGVRVTVPASPQRVAVLGEQTLDHALALGVKPVVIVASRGQKGAPRYLSAKTGGIPIAGTVAEIGVEKVGAQRPDLILVDGGVKFQPVLAKLREFAPVFVAAKSNDQSKDPWKTVFNRVGQVLGKAAAAKQTLANYQRAVTQTRTATSAAAGQTVSIVRWERGKPAYLRRDSTAPAVLTELGFRTPPAQTARGATSFPVGMENLELLDADWIFLGSLRGEPAATLADAQRNPLFARLSAARAKHTVAIDATYWAAPIGIQGATKIVEDVRTGIR